MFVTVLKFTFVKTEPRVIQYRCYKNFDNISILYELRDRLSTVIGYNEFNDVYLDVLNKFAHLNRKLFMLITPLT